MKKALVVLPYANSHLELFINYIQSNYQTDFYIHADVSQYRKNILNNVQTLPSIGYLRTLRNLISNKYDIIFTHGIFYPYLLFLHFSTQNKIIILSEGFNQNFNTGIKGLLKRIHLRSLVKRNNISIFMLGNTHIKQQYEKLATDHIRYFQYGMYPAVNSYLNVKSEKTDPVKFVFAGQFIARKNIQLMLDAITLTSQFQDGKAEFTFIGEGPEVTTILSNPNAKLINTLSKELLFKTLSESDVLVLVSSYEGWGAIVNEACACGCALILSKEIGAAYLFFEDAVNGYYTDMNANSLASIYSLMISNREQLHNMKEASTRIFQMQYQVHDKILYDNISNATQ